MTLQEVVLSILFSLCALNGVHGTRLRLLDKRSTSVTSGTLDIPLTINQDLKYIAGVNMVWIDYPPEYLTMPSLFFIVF